MLCGVCWLLFADCCVLLFVLLKVVCWRLRAVCFLLGVWRLLRVDCCLLFAGCCMVLLFAVCRVLSVACCCVVFVVYGVLCVVCRCLLFVGVLVVACRLFVVRCLLFVACCSLGAAVLVRFISWLLVVVCCSLSRMRWRCAVLVVGRALFVLMCVVCFCSSLFAAVCRCCLWFAVR